VSKSWLLRAAFLSVFILLAFLIAYCAGVRRRSSESPPERARISPVEFVALLYQISDEVQPPWKRRTQATYDRLHREIRSLLKDVTSAATLKACYYACAENIEPFNRRHEGNLKIVNPFFIAEGQVEIRLAELGTDEGARALVGLLGDERLSFDGEGALNIGNAISRCGARALPYLEEVRAGSPSASKRLFASELIQYVRAGRIFGP